MPTVNQDYERYGGLAMACQDPVLEENQLNIFFSSLVKITGSFSDVQRPYK